MSRRLACATSWCCLVWWCLSPVGSSTSPSLRPCGVVTVLLGQVVFSKLGTGAWPNMPKLQQRITAAVAKWRGGWCGRRHSVLVSCGCVREKWSDTRGANRHHLGPWL